MKIKCAVLLIVLGSVAGVVLCGPAPKPRPQEPEEVLPLAERYLLLSKVTLDHMPGETGGFVEVYNPHDKPVDTSGLLIVCDDRQVFAMPEGLRLPGRAILAIRYSEGPPGVLNPWGFRWAPLEVTLRQSNAAIVEVKPLLERPAKLDKRRSGYCALVGQSGKEIHDYVQWGEEERGGKYRLQGKAAGIVAVPPIYVGQSVVEGSPPVPVPPAALVRYAFVQGGRGWKVRPIEQAIPARGNTLPPPEFSGPHTGTAQANDDPMYFSFGAHYQLDLIQPITEEMQKAGMYRLQIARDPQFMEVIYDQQVTGHFGLADLKPGRYFARAMLNAGGPLVSSWSEPIYFSYY